jgi:hypothetical protein
MSRFYGFLIMFRFVFADRTRDGLAREMFESRWEEEQTGLYIVGRLIRFERRKQRLDVEFLEWVDTVI